MKTSASTQLRPSRKAINLVHLLSAGVLLAGLDRSGVNFCLAAETAAPLRVGINPEYPPLVFRQPDGTNGAEIDFAKALGSELGRPVEFVVLRRDELTDALLSRQIDIIMSGMSITKARQLKIRFSEPYVRNEIRAIFPIKEASHYQSLGDILGTKARIGVVPGTTSDVFVKQNCTNAEIVAVEMRRDVPFLLLRGKRIDVYVDDSFALADILSKNEADIAFLRQPLSEENLAWGVRPDDLQFLVSINDTLSRWKSDGTLDRILDRWMPYLKNLRVQQPAAQTK
jgi:polar amino acid transport system substrate-binding protein